MINKKESSKLQKSWNYRQINESYSQDRKHLLRLFIPIIIFLLILGNIYSKASSSMNTVKEYKNLERTKYEDLNRKIEKLFILDDWHGISNILDELPENYKYDDVINFCKGIKCSFVQIGDRDPIIYFESIKPASRVFLLSRIMLLKYAAN